MTTRLSTTRSGVEWVVLREEKALVRDQHGRVLPAPWNPRVKLSAPKVSVVGRVFAHTKPEALRLARAYFPKALGGKEVEVQSAASYAVGLEDAAVVKRNRISPNAASTFRRRTVRVQETP